MTAGQQYQPSDSAPEASVDAAVAAEAADAAGDADAGGAAVADGATVGATVVDGATVTDGAAVIDGAGGAVSTGAGCGCVEVLHGCIRSGDGGSELELIGSDDRGTLQCVSLTHNGGPLDNNAVWLGGLDVNEFENGACI